MTRELLPPRRAATTVDFDHIAPNGKQWPYRATLGFYPDGRLGEIFLGTPKVGTDVDVAVKDSAILASFALQHGASPASLREAMTRDAEGRPEGVMGTLLDLLIVEGVPLPDRFKP